MLARTHIVIHHSLTKDSGTVSWGAIRKYHTITNGWRDIGYHFGVELVGDSYEVLVGRAVTDPAAACRQANMNWRGVHVCLMGNFDLRVPEETQLSVAMERVVRPLMIQHSIKPKNVIGHRDAGLMDGFDWRKDQYKSCPGKMFDMEAFRELAL